MSARSSFHMACRCAGRVTGRQIWARTSHSTKSAPSASNVTKVAKYIAGAGVVDAPGVWWFANGRNKRHLKWEHVQKWQIWQSLEDLQKKKYDGTRAASNSPTEDRYIHGAFPSPWKDGKKWMAWGVLDDHAGWQTADLLEKQLVPFVRHGLDQIKSPSEQVSDEKVSDTIKKAFVHLDDSILKTAVEASQGNLPLQDKLANLAPAFAGSGDSRAVLGQKNAEGKWEAITLSIDQTGDNQEEIARLKKEHPGEEGIVAGGRVLGIMVSRAFGDSRWKWPVDLQKDLKKKFDGPSILTPKYKILTTPYLTAEPVVTSTKIDPSKPSFLIMATDGLWDNLSSQQADDLVVKWIERSTTLSKGLAEPKYEPYDFTKYEWREEFDEKRTTVQDGNAAVHLVRNALGGNHH